MIAEFFIEVNLFNLKFKDYLLYFIWLQIDFFY